MTREEAHRILSNGLVNAPSEHEWCMAFDMAIKALEQESVLDKIRAEIADITDTVEINPESFWNKKLYVRYSDVLNIIDKYKAESEVKE